MDKKVEDFRQKEIVGDSEFYKSGILLILKTVGWDPAAPFVLRWWSKFCRDRVHQ